MPHRCRANPIQEPRDQGEKPGASGLQPHHRTVLTAATHYHQNWHIHTGGFPNASIFIASQPKEGSEHRCARSGEKPALAQSSPLLQARACISSGRASRNCRRKADDNGSVTGTGVHPSNSRAAVRTRFTCSLHVLYLQDYARSVVYDRYQTPVAVATGGLVNAWLVMP
jgi:hypothetical protein